MERDNLDKLATQFIQNALAVAAGERVWLEHQGEATWPLARACRDKIAKLGGSPHIVTSGSVAIANMMKAAGKGQDRKRFLSEQSEMNLQTMQSMDAYIRIDDFADSARANISVEDSACYHGEIMNRATQHRVKKARWLVVDAPTIEFARACGMSKPEFDQFYLNACMIDYRRMSDAAEPLAELMCNADQVHLTGRGTDISFSIKNIGGKKCVGERNMPDGECFSAPVRESVNGTVLYEKSVYMGVVFPWVKFECRDGRIETAVSATEELTIKLNKILDTDEGSRYFGEFAIAFHPTILYPVGSILFDEKITGSFHLTPGQCYEDWANNGNQSNIHWDLVKIQRPEYGGGDVIIDGDLIRRDGWFVPKRLQGLNLRNMKS